MLHKLITAVTAWGALASLALAIVPLQASAQTVVVPPPAWNDTAIISSCSGSRRSESCITTFHTLNPNPYVIHVRPPISEQEVAEYQLRDRRWVERCKPTIRQDSFGVPRYFYAARG